MGKKGKKKFKDVKDSMAVHHKGGEAVDMTSKHVTLGLLLCLLYDCIENKILLKHEYNIDDSQIPQQKEKYRLIFFWYVFCRNMSI